MIDAALAFYRASEKTGHMGRFFYACSVLESFSRSIAPR
jgi:hypothetical protein